MVAALSARTAGSQGRRNAWYAAGWLVRRGGWRWEQRASPRSAGLARSLFSTRGGAL